MRKTKTIKKHFLVWLPVATALLVAAFLFQERRQNNQNSGIIRVQVDRGEIESTVTAQGKLEPKEYVDVGAQVSGQLKTLHVELGDVVKKGDLIAEIDPELYSTTVEANRSRLKTLEAQRLEQQAQVEQALLVARRYEKLIQSKAISQALLEEAQTELKVAKSRVQSLDAQIAEAKSTLAGNETRLNYTQIYAPMDGTIVSQSAREGQTLNANQTTPTIVQVANLDVMTVRAQVAEADITRITEGMPVYFTTLGSDGRRWEGRVRQVLPSPEIINDVVLYNVLMDIENKDRTLMSSMSTQMFFVLGRAKDTLLVPVAALGKRMPEADTQQGQAYQIQTDKGAKTVLVGLQNRSQAQVLSGLEVGERVLIGADPGDKETGKGDRPPSPRGAASL